MIGVLGIAGWAAASAVAGWVSGLVNVQLVDNRNYKRSETERLRTDAILAEGRANQAARLAALVAADEVEAYAMAEQVNA